MIGSASADLEAAILGHTLGYAPMPPTIQVFVALCMASATPTDATQGVEVSGGGYARMAALFQQSSPSNIATNGSSVEFSAATTNWGAVGYFEIWTAQTGGSRLYWGSLADPADGVTPITETVEVGDVMRFSPGTLRIYATSAAADQWPFLPLSGGTMAGPLLLDGDPAVPTEAATKQYVDTTVGGGVGGPFLPVMYTASGGTTSRSGYDHAADVVYAKDFGAVFDGNSHPLAAYYATLAAAQAVYPKATALTNEIDGIAIQAALDFCAARSGVANDYSYGGTVVLPNAKGLMNTPLTINASCVAMRSQGHGITMRELVSRFAQSAPCHLQWTGPAVTTGNPCVYMLTAAVTDGGRRLSGCNVEGVFFDCNKVVGVSGVLIASVFRSKFYIGVAEARGVPYPSAVLTAGSQNITVSSSANIGIGQSITSPSTSDGAYVAAIVDGVTIQSSIQSLASATETVLIGGECIRLDCVSSISDVNDTQHCDCWFICNQEVGAQYSYGPCIVLNGSSNPGSAPGLAHYGNTSVNTFHLIYCSVVYGSGLVVNNTDHNYFLNVGVTGLGGTPKGIVFNGSLSATNGGARYNVFDYAGVTIWSMGTDTGGFTSAAAANIFRNLDVQNGGVISHTGTGSSVAVSNMATPTLMIPCNTTAPVVAHMPDSTTAGGNNRGPYSVDLQLFRTAATQVASGQESAILSGISGTASAQYAVVLGGTGCSASAIGTLAFGVNSVASAPYSFAFGLSALADQQVSITLSGGVIASGRHAQNTKQLMRAVSAANTTPVRLTADMLAAGSNNVCNLTYSGSVYSLTVLLTAIDATNGGNYYSWTQPLGLLRRNGAVGTTAYTPVGTPVVGGAGTTAGIAITEAADTTNGGYSLTFTPPTGNTAIWRVCATVEWTRVDGA